MTNTQKPNLNRSGRSAPADRQRTGTRETEGGQFPGSSIEGEAVWPTYKDEQSIYATIIVDGKEIRLRSTPEADRFLDSFTALETADELLGASVWLGQNAAACICNPEALSFEPVPIAIGQRKVAPRSTPEAEEFVATLLDLHDREYLTAFGHFLNSIAEALCYRAEAAAQAC